MSLIVWGIIGLVAGIIVGALQVDVSGSKGLGNTVANVRVDVFGHTIRQGVGPEPMESVVWTWGIGIVGLFGFVGAGICIAIRVGAFRYATQRNAPPPAALNEPLRGVTKENAPGEWDTGSAD